MQNPAQFQQPAPIPSTPDPSPQSRPLQQPQPSEPVSPLAHSGEENTIIDLEATGSKIYVWITKILGIGLACLALYHIYESMQFIFVEAPLLNEFLESGEISRDEVIVLVAKAVMQFISASINFLLALHLAKISENATKFLDVFAGIVLIFVNILIIDFFRQIDADVLVSNVFNSILMYGMVLPQRLLELLP